ncbi:MAG: 50S ribosomal protein L35 [Candidatus Omnitrophota bacterium]
MGKLKTKKGVAKRFRLTKKGKIKYGTCGKKHLMSSKTRKRLRGLRKSKIMRDKADAGQLKKMLPYG